MSKILVFGDIIGRPGREAVAHILPELKKEFVPDLIIANVENSAHGKGVTMPIMRELTALGIDVFTSGNHVFDKRQQAEECFASFSQLLRPHNYVGNFPGRGVFRLEKAGQGYVIINLNGRVFFDKNFPLGMDNPFFMAEQLIKANAKPDDIILIDLHAEATSEKVAFGWYMDGKVSAVWGTHTHVPTQDWRVLPKGTAVVTDVGMTGPLNSVIGVVVENSLNLFLEHGKFTMEPEPSRPLVVNALVITCGVGSAPHITKVQKIIE